MPHHQFPRHGHRMLLIFCLWLLSIPALARDSADPDAVAVPGSPARSGQAADDDGVPYGVASGYIIGHKLLQEGKTEEALPYLHMAYRAQPEVADIALDFQSALAAAGYFKDALEVVNKLIAQHPDSLAYVAERATLYLKSGRTGPALADLRALRAGGLVNPSIIEAEAGVLASGGKTEQALDVYREGLELMPEAGARMYLGMTAILQQAGRDARVPALMDEALARFPDEPRLWLVKARVQAVLKDDEGALATAQAADNHFAALTVAQAVLEPGFPEDVLPGGDEVEGLPKDSFVVELADFHAQRGEVGKAVAILEPISDSGELQLSPSLWLARLLLGTGRSEEAEALVTRILDRWPASGRAWYLRGKVSEGRGDWTGSLPHYVKAVDLDPRDPELRLGYVRAMLVGWERDLTMRSPGPVELERRQDFERQVMAASTIVPDEDREGQLILGYAFKAIGNLDRAAWRFGLAAESKELRLNALLQRSLCHDQLGDEKAARKDLETLYTEYPGNPEVANSLGYFLAEKGVDLAHAAKLVAVALKAEPGNGAYLDSMGWIHYRRGDLESALDYMIRAVNVLPEDPVILEHLGMVLKGQGKRVEARDVLRRALEFGGDRARIEPLVRELESGPDGR